MKSKLYPLRLLLTVGLAASPVTVWAHQGHDNSLWHAVLHMIETNGAGLVLISMVIIAALVWNVKQRRSSSAALRTEIRKAQDHDPR
jgi:hypothetical protein